MLDMRFPLQTCPFIQIGITSENIEMVVEQLASVVSVATDERDQISGNAAIISSTLSSAATVVTSGNFSIDIPVRLNMACACVVLLVHVYILPYLHGTVFYVSHGHLHAPILVQSLAHVTSLELWVCIKLL